jgi:hypothetical protein
MDASAASRYIVETLLNTQICELEKAGLRIGEQESGVSSRAR